MDNNTTLDKKYEAGPVESKWAERWIASKVFRGEPGKGGRPYTMAIPPPNVTGILHMGHALNVTIQDILARWRRMQGYNTVWVPGTDHAGIATQNVVERALRSEKLTRDQLGRERFVERVWQWREQYGGTIIRQLKRLGCSCDWDRERFTMDDGLSAAVTEVFSRLYEKKLVYRGNYIINWCPRCGTALSDEESEHRETRGKLYYIRYPLKGGGRKHVVVATTRPETMLGDVAIAVNPRDARYAGLADSTVLLPLLKRELRIVRDDYVDPEFGTGIVKVTPAHDPNDFEMGRRHGLEPINVMTDRAVINENGGPYKGLDRFACREKLLEDLAKERFIEKIEDHVHSVGHCYRCDCVVEPRISLQWFVKMKPLARPAIEAVKQGRIRFVPERWTKVYLEWMENVRDWCISRQIWWGHRIPVYYCDSCANEWVSKSDPGECPKCGSHEIRRDPDVLDTWFSSWLWPFSVFGWPEPNESLAFYYPTDTLVTASEIIFFWVARMIAAGMELMNDIPFRNVYIHGTVRDDKGRKMSKSLGNSIDPLAIINEYSADALRFSLMMATAVGQDIYISNEKFELGRNFLTKIWNAARFIKMYPMPEGFPAGAPFSIGQASSSEDKYILALLSERIVSYNGNLERFRFNDAAKDIYDFTWRQFCDWHIEHAKFELGSGAPERAARTLAVTHHVFAAILRLLHPFIPFITEELWHAMGYAASEGDFITAAAWPQAMTEDELAKYGITPQMVQYVGDKHELIRLGRTLRADYGLSPAAKPDYVIRPNPGNFAAWLDEDKGTIIALLKASSLRIAPDFVPSGAMPQGGNNIGVIYMPIKGLIDPEREAARLNAQLEEINTGLASANRKLNNEEFLKKAPPEVVEAQRMKRRELIEKSEKTAKLLEIIRGAGE